MFDTNWNRFTAEESSVCHFVCSVSQWIPKIDIPDRCRCDTSSNVEFCGFVASKEVIHLFEINTADPSSSTNLNIDFIAREIREFLSDATRLFEEGRNSSRSILININIMEE